MNTSMEHSLILTIENQNTREETFPLHVHPQKISYGLVRDRTWLPRLAWFNAPFHKYSRERRFWPKRKHGPSNFRHICPILPCVTFFAFPILNKSLKGISIWIASRRQNIWHEYCNDFGEEFFSMFFWVWCREWMNACMEWPHSVTEWVIALMGQSVRVFDRIHTSLHLLGRSEQNYSNCSLFCLQPLKARHVSHHIMMVYHISRYTKRILSH